MKDLTCPNGHSQMFTVLSGVITAPPNFLKEFQPPVDDSAPIPLQDKCVVRCDVCNEEFETTGVMLAMYAEWQQQDDYDNFIQFRIKGKHAE